MKTMGQNRNIMYNIPLKQIEDQTKLILRIENVLQNTPKGANREFLESFMETLIQKEMMKNYDLPPKYQQRNTSEIPLKSTTTTTTTPKDLKKETKSKKYSFSGLLNTFGLGGGKKSSKNQEKCQENQVPVIPYNSGDKISPLRRPTSISEKNFEMPCIITKKLPISPVLNQNQNQTDEEQFISKILSTPWKLNCPFDRITIIQSYSQMDTICEESS